MSASRRAAVLVVLSLALTGCAAQGTAGKPAAKGTAGQPAWVPYKNQSVGISLRHPPGWKPVKGYLWRVGGKDGFVALDALDGAGWDARQAALHEASQVLRPFGTSPKIEKITAGGQAGYIILPSANADQPPGPPMAEVVVPFPSTQVISGVQYHFLILDATASLIRRIASTLQFIR